MNPSGQQKEENGFEGFRKRYRWWFLGATLLCDLAFMYNNTSILTLQIPLEKEFDLNDLRYGQILLFQHLPGIISPIISGFLADRYGSAFIFGLGLALNYIGQFILTYAATCSHFWVFIVGQLLLATGTQGLMISKSKMFKCWFSTKEIGKAMSTSMIIGTLGITLCDIGYPNLYQISQSLFLPFMVGSGLLLVTLPFGVAQIILHKRLLIKYQRIQDAPLEEAFEERLSLCSSLKAVKRFPKTFWLLLVFSITSFLSFFCTKVFTTRYLITQFNLSIGGTGVLLAVAMVIAGVGTILFGIILDRYGRLPLSAIVGSALITVGIIINMVLPKSNNHVVGGVPLTIMSLGAGISQLVSVLITMRLIRGPSMGVALGFSAFLTSATMMFFPTIEGLISDKTFNTSGYFWVFFLNAGLGVVSCLVALVILIADSKGSKRLQSVCVPPPTRSNTRSIRSSMATVTSEHDVHIQVIGSSNQHKGGIA